MIRLEVTCDHLRAPGPTTGYCALRDIPVKIGLLRCGICEHRTGSYRMVRDKPDKPPEAAPQPAQATTGDCTPCEAARRARAAARAKPKPGTIPDALLKPMGIIPPDYDPARDFHAGGCGCDPVE